MIKLLPIAFLFVLSTIAQGQIVNIPDANFKNALVNTICVDTSGNCIPDSTADFNFDGEIQESEAELVLCLDVGFENIASLEGIQYFINLINLDCTANQLTSLDLSQNTNLEYLDCKWNNTISNLNVTQCPNLRILYCYDNALTSLDVSNNPNLEILYCTDNQLTNLDVNQNEQLIDLYCYDNSITSLDVSQNQELIYLGCGFNPLENVDLSLNVNLERLFFANTNITSLDLSSNPNIFWIRCDNNSNLSYLNLQNSNNPIITIMLAYDNPNLQCILVDDENYSFPLCDLNNGTGWCKDSSTYYSENCDLGVNENIVDRIIISPNPVNKILNISNKDGADIISITIYNLNGELVFTSDHNFNNLNLSILKTGIYFGLIRTSENIVLKKIIKK